MIYSRVGRVHAYLAAAGKTLSLISVVWGNITSLGAVLVHVGSNGSRLPPVAAVIHQRGGDHVRWMQVLIQKDYDLGLAMSP